MKKFTFVALLLLLANSACTPTVNVRGNMLQNYQISQVQTGIDTQSDVLKKLGSPTTKAPFDDNTWYYMGQRTEKHGILDPKVVEEKVVTVKFDKNGVVQEIAAVDPKRLNIPYDRDKTPTSGSEMTMMQQLVGNMGKFNKAGPDKSSSATTGGGMNIP